jgi:predicted outer membrane protein
MNPVRAWWRREDVNKESLMSTRQQRRVVWPFALALLGVAACGGTKTKPSGTGTPGTTTPGTATPGTPGGTTTPGTTTPGGETHKPGGTHARVPGRGRPVGGTRAPGAGLDPQIEGICGGVRSARARGQKVSLECAPGQEVAQGITTDSGIAGALAAADKVEVEESAFAEKHARSPVVRNFAHLMAIAHNHALAENQIIFTRIAVRPDAAAQGQGIERSLLHGFSTAKRGRGDPLDRDYMRRQILEHQRLLQLVDALLPAVQNAELRCALDRARDDALTHLEMACWVWSRMPGMGKVGNERVGKERVARGQAALEEGDEILDQAGDTDDGVDDEDVTDGVDATELSGED